MSAERSNKRGILQRKGPSVDRGIRESAGACPLTGYIDDCSHASKACSHATKAELQQRLAAPPAPTACKQQQRTRHERKGRLRVFVGRRTLSQATCACLHTHHFQHPQAAMPSARPPPGVSHAAHHPHPSHPNLPPTPSLHLSAPDILRPHIHPTPQSPCPCLFSLSPPLLFTCP